MDTFARSHGPRPRIRPESLDSGRSHGRHLRGQDLTSPTRSMQVKIDTGAKRDPRGEALFQVNRIIQRLAPNVHHWDRSVFFSIDRLKEDTGWKPEYTFQRGRGGDLGMDAIQRSRPRAWNSTSGLKTSCWNASRPALTHSGRKARGSLEPPAVVSRRADSTSTPPQRHRPRRPTKSGPAHSNRASCTRWSRKDGIGQDSAVMA